MTKIKADKNETSQTLSSTARGNVDGCDDFGKTMSRAEGGSAFERRSHAGVNSEEWDWCARRGLMIHSSDE